MPIRINYAGFLAWWPRKRISSRDMSHIRLPLDASDAVEVGELNRNDLRPTAGDTLRLFVSNPYISTNATKTARPANSTTAAAMTAATAGA